MDAVLSGNSCQGRDVAYLRVTNNWQRDREDYKEKTRRTGGGDHRERRTRAMTKYCCQHINYILSGLVDDSRTAVVCTVLLWQHMH